MDRRRRIFGWVVGCIAYTALTFGGMVAFIVFTDGIVKWVGATVMAFFAGHAFELIALARAELSSTE
jgi:hypothetical protein